METLTDQTVFNLLTIVSGDNSIWTVAKRAYLAFDILEMVDDAFDNVADLPENMLDFQDIMDIIKELQTEGVEYEESEKI